MRYTWERWYLCVGRTGLTAVAGGVACLFSDTSQVIAMVGSLCAVPIMYCIPCAMHMALPESAQSQAVDEGESKANAVLRWMWRRGLPATVFCFGLGVSVSGAILTIIGTGG